FSWSSVSLGKTLSWQSTAINLPQSLEKLIAEKPLLCALRYALCAQCGRFAANCAQNRFAAFCLPGFEPLSLPGMGSKTAAFWCNLAKRALQKRKNGATTSILVPLGLSRNLEGITKRRAGSRAQRDDGFCAVFKPIASLPVPHDT
ncbi:MAG: hypothetical protein FWD72_06825, partial [Eggerthellaceae bacterium]|nr:hypothetical protein [Eggerthellaceae bacterium]